MHHKWLTLSRQHRMVVCGADRLACAHGVFPGSIDACSLGGIGRIILPARLMNAQVDLAARYGDKLHAEAVGEGFARLHRIDRPTG